MASTNLGGTPAAVAAAASAAADRPKPYPHMPFNWSPERQEMYLQGHVLVCYNAHTAMHHIRANWGNWCCPSEPFKLAEEKQQWERSSGTGVTSGTSVRGDSKWHKKLLGSFKAACQKMQHRSGRVPCWVSKSLVGVLQGGEESHDEGEYMWEHLVWNESAGAAGGCGKYESRACQAGSGGRLSSFVLDQVVELYWSS